ncbi:MAG: hypothetical protein ISQ09_10380 [Rubripirellula sp.]|nr:hypothetical protein [Rubripirellula sp.]
MFQGSLILGVTLCLFSAWLHRTEKHGWPNESFETELDRQYRSRRLNSRRRIHYLIAACGGLILVAAFWGPGVTWVICWSLVMLMLLLVVFLAAADAVGTHRYHQKKLPEIQKQTLGDSDA